MKDLFARTLAIVGEGWEEWIEAAIAPYLETIYNEAQQEKDFGEIWAENQAERINSILMGIFISSLMNAGYDVASLLTTGQTQTASEIERETQEQQNSANEGTLTSENQALISRRLK